MALSVRFFITQLEYVTQIIRVVWRMTGIYRSLSGGFVGIWQEIDSSRGILRRLRAYPIRRILLQSV